MSNQLLDLETEERLLDFVDVGRCDVDSARDATVEDDVDRFADRVAYLIDPVAVLKVFKQCRQLAIRCRVDLLGRSGNCRSVRHQLGPFGWIDSTSKPEAR